MKKFEPALCLISVLLLIQMAGCSSLPDKPRPDAELNSRTASLHKLGRQHYQAGRLARAETYFSSALAVHARMDDEAGVALSYLSLGRVLLAQGQVGAASESFQQARISANSRSRTDLAAQALGGLAAVQMSQDQPDQALELLELALNLPLKPESRERAVLKHDLGSALFQGGDHEGALPHLQEALAIHEKNNDRQGQATVYYTLALLQEELGNRPEALQMARMALHNDKAVLNGRGVLQDLRLLQELHTRDGNTELAASYQRRADLARQGFLTEEP
jgi:tetratricopeptide (TPR) repeat protein